MPYNQATANTQIVGIDIANLISSLISNNEAKKDDFHCIGLGLGKFICIIFFFLKLIIFK